MRCVGQKRSCKRLTGAGLAAENSGELWNVRCMGWTIFYSVLLVAYVTGWLYSLHHPNSAPEIISKASGLVALLSAFATALQKSSLRVYFLFQKIAIRFFPDTTSRWWFAARYDGQFKDDAVHRLIEHFQSSQFRFPVRVEREDKLQAQIEVDQTLTINMQFDSRQVSEDQRDHFTVLSKVMEVSYGHAKKKLDLQIVPVLQAISDVLRPENSSFELDVQFLGRNPFFAVYISHLRPDQVQDYRVVLHVDGGHSTGRTERVEITKEKVHVTARTTNAFRSIAEQFVLLSPDLKLLKAGH